MRTIKAVSAFLLVQAFIGLASGRVATPLAPQKARHRIAFSRTGPLRMSVFIADGDGRNERPLLPVDSMDYNASFSADGKWIVFTSERAGSADIYRVHPDGSGLERLTDSPAYDDQAALSPDGSTLAFVSTRQSGTADVCVLDLATHQYRNLTHHSSGNFRPSWSPDGKWIAFTSDRGSHPGRVPDHWELLHATGLYVVGADGTGLRQLKSPAEFVGSPKWSPNGRRLVAYELSALDGWYTRSRSGPRPASVAQIVSVDSTTGGDRRVHTTGTGINISPQWMDSTRIAYVRKRGPDPGLEFTSGEMGARGEFRNPSWSPDGKYVVYHKELPGERSWMTSTLSHDPEFELMLTEPFPTYSASGDRLVVSARPEEEWPIYDFEQAGLTVMNADGGSRKMIFYEKDKLAYGASWSPHEDLIAFGVGVFFFRPASWGQLALIKPDGTGFRMITSGAAKSGFPSWSPDGTRLVYRADGKQGRGLMILTIADGRVSPLQTGSGYDNFPAWSPRGDLIAFTSFREGDYDIYTIGPDGTGLRRLTTGAGNHAHSTWSPDGEWIVFSSSRLGFKDEGPLYYKIPQPYGQLFAMRRDGTSVKQLTDTHWEVGSPAWMPER